MRGGLGRHQALGIRPIALDFRQHPNRDGGVRTTGAKMLTLEQARFRHALLVLDYEGSGAADSAQDLEQSLDAELASTWEGRAKAIVIEPEVDSWVWGSDNLLAELLNWPLDGPIREWLESEGYVVGANGKPERPKEALEEVFHVCRLPRSAANYRKIAERVSMTRCQDPAFQRLRMQLQEWFPLESRPNGLTCNA